MPPGHKAAHTQMKDERHGDSPKKVNHNLYKRKFLASR